MKEPLAARMRPQSLDAFVGQSHLLKSNSVLAQAYAERQLHSMILWGPPGSGKTTLGLLLANRANAHIEKISAVMGGVKDIRAAIAQANAKLPEQKTVLFIDEIHRFNKAQQDALLPVVESGLLTLIGATTENPSFELNNALLSRTQVYVLQAHNWQTLFEILRTAIIKLNVSADKAVTVTDEILTRVAKLSDGDARQALNTLDTLMALAQDKQSTECVIDAAVFEKLNHTLLRRFDKGGDQFYDLISALHKSVRGSDPDAALYWFARLLDGGCDPRYIARRVLRMASEDIGNADPRALTIARDSCDIYERLGSPEGELAIAQAIVYLASAAKSNAVYLGFNRAMALVKAEGSRPVPNHLCNAPTPLMKKQGKAKAYRYAHDEPYGYAAGEHYFPDGMRATHFYQPVNRGLENKIGEKLQFLRQLDSQSKAVHDKLRQED